MAPNLDRDAARTLVDAGYMPVKRYIELFGDSEVLENRPARAAAEHHRLPRNHQHPRRRKTKTHKAA